MATKARSVGTHLLMTSMETGEPQLQPESTVHVVMRSSCMPTALVTFIVACKQMCHCHRHHCWVLHSMRKIAGSTVSRSITFETPLLHAGMMVGITAGSIKVRLEETIDLVSVLQSKKDSGNALCQHCGCMHCLADTAACLCLLCFRRVLLCFSHGAVMLAAQDADRHENGGRHANGHSSQKESDGVRPHVDGACAQRGDIKYGLNYGGGDAPDEEARWVFMHGPNTHYRTRTRHTLPPRCSTFATR